MATSTLSGYLHTTRDERKNSRSRVAGKQAKPLTTNDMMPENASSTRPIRFPKAQRKALNPETCAASTGPGEDGSGAAADAAAGAVIAAVAAAQEARQTLRDSQLRLVVRVAARYQYSANAALEDLVTVRNAFHVEMRSTSRRVSCAFGSGFCTLHLKARCGFVSLDESAEGGGKPGLGGHLRRALQNCLA